MTGATNETAEEPCYYLDRRAASTETRPAGTAPTDMKELLAMLQDIERTLQAENGGTPALSATPDGEQAGPPGPALQFVRAALISPEAAKDREPEAELAPWHADDVELFLGQLPFNFSHAALARGLQQLTDAPRAIVTRVKPGPKPTCAFISVIKDYAPRLAGLNKRILCERDGFWVAPLHTGGDGLAEIASQVKLRAANHVVGLPTHPLVIEPVACKSKAAFKDRLHNASFPPQPHVPPTYGQFVADGAYWPWVPPHPSFQLPFFNPYGGCAALPFAAYPPPLMSLPPAASMPMNCTRPYQAPMPPLARPMCTVAPHAKQSAKAHAQPRLPAT